MRKENNKKEDSVINYQTENQWKPNMYFKN